MTGLRKSNKKIKKTKEEPRKKYRLNAKSRY